MRELIICAQLNEGMSREPNPHVPYTPSEIAADARACREAGAALVHVHARTADGAMDLSPLATARMVAAIHAESDILVAPPLLNVPGADDEDRVAALVAGEEEPGDPGADFVVVEMGTTNFDLVDPGTGDFLTTDRVFTTTARSQLRFIAESRRRGLPVLATSFGAAWTRAIEVHRRNGRLAGPLLVLLVHGGPEFIAAHPADSSGLAAHRALLPRDGDVEWMVSAHRGNVLELAEEVIAGGGHIAIGVGDHAHEELGCPSNAELVGRVAEIGRRHGRPPATPEAVRRRFAAVPAEALS